MYPILFKIGPVPVHTYGLMIAIGFLIAVKVIRSLSSRSGLPENPVLDLTFYSLLVGIIGARSLFVITQWHVFKADPLAIFKVWEGGLVFFGGPLLVLPFVIAYTRKFKLDTWKIADVFMPGLTIAHAFGRFGCLAAGCCYGKPTGTEFGIRFYSDLVDKHLHGIPLHPTQLYESSALIILFFGLLAIFKRRRFNGQVALTYFMVYPIIRSIVESFRGDIVRGFVLDGWLSTSQFISLLMFLGASVFLYFRLKQVSGASLKRA